MMIIIIYLYVLSQDFFAFLLSKLITHKKSPV